MLIKHSYHLEPSESSKQEQDLWRTAIEFSAVISSAVTYQGHSHNINLRFLHSFLPVSISFLKYVLAKLRMPNAKV